MGRSRPPIAAVRPAGPALAPERARPRPGLDALLLNERDLAARLDERLLHLFDRRELVFVQRGAELVVAHAVFAQHLHADPPVVDQQRCRALDEALEAPGA